MLKGSTPLEKIDFPIIAQLKLEASPELTDPANHAKQQKINYKREVFMLAKYATTMPDQSEKCWKMIRSYLGIDKSIDIYAQNSNGKCLMEYAMSSNNKSVIETFIDMEQHPSKLKAIAYYVYQNAFALSILAYRKKITPDMFYSSSARDKYIKRTICFIESIKTKKLLDQAVLERANNNRWNTVILLLRLEVVQVNTLFNGETLRDIASSWANTDVDQMLMRMGGLFSADINNQEEDMLVKSPFQRPASPLIMCYSMLTENSKGYKFSENNSTAENDENAASSVNTKKFYSQRRNSL